MPRVHYRTPGGEVEVIEGKVGDSVMITAVRNGISGIVGQCGGNLSCATCHVHLDEDEMSRYHPPVTTSGDFIRLRTAITHQVPVAPDEIGDPESKPGELVAQRLRASTKSSPAR